MERDVPRHRARAERDGELARVEDARVVLRQLEAQHAAERIGVVALDDVDAAGVGAGDEAALLEDEPEELVELPLGGDRLRDLDELAQLVAVAVQPFAAALRPRLGFHELEGAMDGDEDLVGARVGGDDRGEPPVERLGEIGLGGAAEQHQHRLALGKARGERAQRVAAPVPHGRGRDEHDARLLAHRDEERVHPRHHLVRQAWVGDEARGHRGDGAERGVDLVDPRNGMLDRRARAVDRGRRGHGHLVLSSRFASAGSGVTPRSRRSTRRSTPRLAS